MADIVATTKAGQKLLAEVKALHGQPPANVRVKELKELVHSVFVRNVPRDSNGRPVADRQQYCYEIFLAVKKAVRDIAQRGGVGYDEAVLTLKYAWTGPEAFQKALQVLQVPA
jgi:hypothetical protein